MESRRFDQLAKAVAVSGSRRQVLAAVLAGVLGGLRSRVAAAADDGPEIASAGNGGVATASANGGAVAIGDVNSGGNAGNAIGVGDTVGAVDVDGGDVGNATEIAVTADGGTGIADASGGTNNLSFVS